MVFDNTSLERRRRKRLIRPLGEFVASRCDGGTQVMVGVSAPDLEIIQPFTTDRSQLSAALEKVAGTDTEGEMVKNSRRLLRRSVLAAQTVTETWRAPPGS